MLIKRAPPEATAVGRPAAGSGSTWLGTAALLVLVPFHLSFAGANSVYVATIDPTGVVRMVGDTREDQFPDAFRFCCNSSGISQMCRGPCVRNMDGARCQHSMHRKCMDHFRFFSWRESFVNRAEPTASSLMIDLSGPISPLPVDETEMGVHRHRAPAFGTLAVYGAVAFTAAVVIILVVHASSTDGGRTRGTLDLHEFHAISPLPETSVKLCLD